MKKVLSIFVITFLLLQNISFAEFNIETKLSTQKQDSYKKQIDTVYKWFEKKFQKLNKNKQILDIEKIIWRIETLLKNKISDKNNFVLSYLNYLLKEKLEVLQKNDEKSCNIENWIWLQEWDWSKWSECRVNKCNSWYERNGLSKCTKIVTKDIYIDIKKELNNQKTTEKKVCYWPNWVWEEIITFENWVELASTWCRFTRCNSWYNDVGWTCIKKVETHINENNQITTRKCHIENWQWQEIFQNNSWWNCIAISCSGKYKLENNKCMYTLPYFTSFQDNLWNHYTNILNKPNLSNILNEKGWIFVASNIYDVVNINLWINSIDWNSLLCQTITTYYKWTQKTESKELWQCGNSSWKSLQTWYREWWWVKKSYTKIEVKFWIKEWQLYNIKQISESFVPIDSVKVIYIIEDKTFNNCVNPLWWTILHSNRDIAWIWEKELNNWIHTYNIYKTCNDWELISEYSDLPVLKSCNEWYTKQDGICKKNTKFSFYNSELYWNKPWDTSIIYDDETNLYWISNGSSINNLRWEEYINYTKFTREEAENFCKNLDVGWFNIWTWRLPTKEELLSIFIRDWNWFNLTYENFFTFKYLPYNRWYQTDTEKGYWTTTENKEYSIDWVWLVDYKWVSTGSRTKRYQDMFSWSIIENYVRCVNN